MEDAFGREISYLRISVTDRCDFRCSYCLPRGYRGYAATDDWLTVAEVGRLSAIFARLGVRHVRLTGGEPLLRRDIVDLSRVIETTPGIDEVTLSTNGSQLGRLALPLYQSGVSRLNISLDSLDPETFHHLTGGRLAAVLSGIDAAVEAGFSPIKINMVMMRGINDHEVVRMVELCRQKRLTLRFIEAMPIGDNGIASQEHYLPLSEVERELRRHYTLHATVMRGSGPARYFRVGESALVVGFITPQSQHFCDSCNRVRLSVTGELHLCLDSDAPLSLRALLRRGASDEEVSATIVSALATKPARHTFGQTDTHTLRPMSALGG
ncbi:MAG: GTP 3',8-cyclase MoaA [Gammaproteobacteria bacterium]|nr:GTP 3',8-cyclase MoaA [Gammaproteobacteria bacterium]